MGSLADDVLDDQPSALRVWGLRALILLAVVVLVVLMMTVVRNLMRGAAAPKRQEVKIALLPDTPPPPPPKEEKKIEPKEPPKAQPLEQPKQPDKPPEPQQLKMEGPAGNAPSPFASGAVKNDYIGGNIGNGGDKYAGYTGRLVEEIQNALARRKLHGAGGKVFLWLLADGRVDRFKLGKTTGGPDSERDIQAAFADLHRVEEAPPADMPMPIGLDITVQ